MLKIIEKLKNLLFGPADEADDDSWEWAQDGGKVLDRRKMNLSDREQMKKYVRECCEQMKEATEEIDSISMEYKLVTDRLKDMEELEQALAQDKQKIEKAARKIVELSQDRNVHKERTGSMGEEQYQKMLRLEGDMPDSLVELKKNEEYKILVKQDLQNLEGEKVSYKFRRMELVEAMNSARQFSAITIFTAIGLVCILLFLQFMLDYDVQFGYVLTVAIGASLLTYFFVKYQNASAERKVVEKKVNQAISVQNTVKIRYVNVTNVIEYIYAKFGVNSSNELEYLWEKYVAEKRERDSLRNADLLLTKQQDELLELLRQQRLSAPEIWIGQAAALLDQREMVEIRHGLIARRQKLRKRIEYNEENRNSAKDEVKELVKLYPQHSSLILDIVDGFN